MENSVAFDPSLEYGATFRFPVTWSYLTATPPGQASTNLVLSSNQATAPAPKLRPLEIVDLPPVKDPPPAVVPVEAKIEQPPPPPPAPEPVAASIEVVAAPEAGAVALLPSRKPKPPAGPEAKWEMVIPKMTRPISSGLGLRRPRALSQASQSPAPAATEAPTEISFYAGSEASFVPRRWKVLSLSSAVVLVACLIAWVRPGSHSSSAETAPTASGTWSRRTAYLVGSRDPREILVYSGSQDVKNYRIEFSWVPDSRGVGWIFRASDSANYYAAKLRLMQGGATPTLSAERFTVVKGVEGAHVRKVITLGRTNNEVLVRMDATGPAFTLYLQGVPSDYWTDERFESGSLGFYEERGERPVLHALRFTLFKKGGLQTVQTSLQ